MRAGGSWRPWAFYIRSNLDGEIFIITELWDGRPGSAQKQALERSGRDRFTRLPENALDIRDAVALIEEYKRLWADQHGLKRAPDALVLDCRQAYSDGDRREIWRQQGGTVLERIADQCGVQLLDILTEYHQPLEKVG